MNIIKAKSALFAFLIFGVFGTPAKAAGVSVGDNFIVGFKPEGRFAVGNNSHGQLGLGDYENRSKFAEVDQDQGNVWMMIAAGKNHAFGIKYDGSLWGWGCNNFGQLGLGDNVDRNVPTLVGESNRWDLVVTGRNHTLARDICGRLYSWGSNNSGQLGLGDNVDRNVPTLVGKNTDWKIVAAGRNHTLGIRYNDSLWAWGSNNSGQLGLEKELSLQNIPTQVDKNTNWQIVAAGGNCTVASEVGRANLVILTDDFSSNKVSDCFQRFRNNIRRFKHYFDKTVSLEQAIVIGQLGILPALVYRYYYGSWFYLFGA